MEEALFIEVGDGCHPQVCYTIENNEGVLEQHCAISPAWLKWSVPSLALVNSGGWQVLCLQTGGNGTGSWPRRHSWLGRLLVELWLGSHHHRCTTESSLRNKMSQTLSRRYRDYFQLFFMHSGSTLCRNRNSYITLDRETRLLFILHEFTLLRGPCIERVTVTSVIKYSDIDPCASYNWVYIHMPCPHLPNELKRMMFDWKPNRKWEVYLCWSLFKVRDCMCFQSIFHLSSICW